MKKVIGKYLLLLGVLLAVTSFTIYYYSMCYHVEMLGNYYTYKLSEYAANDAMLRHLMDCSSFTLIGFGLALKQKLLTPEHIIYKQIYIVLGAFFGAVFFSYITDITIIDLWFESKKITFAWITAGSLCIISLIVYSLQS